MDIKIIKAPITIAEVTIMAEQQFGDVIKATVDVEHKIMALGGDLHADEEQLLLEAGSAQQSLWGINLYPAKFGTTDFIEFGSMINLRPSQGNMTRGVDNQAVQKQIIDVVHQLVTKGTKRAT